MSLLFGTSHLIVACFTHLLPGRVLAITTVSPGSQKLCKGTFALKILETSHLQHIVPWGIDPIQLPLLQPFSIFLP
jgi:hypothetical protein